MKKVLLPIIGALLACLGLLAYVVFNENVLGIICICIGILFQVVNYFLIIKDMKNKKNSLN